MSKEISNDQDKKAFNMDNVSISTAGTCKLIMPLNMTWKPKLDITAHELALCLPYLFRHTFVMPYEIDKDEPHMRHFEIHDPN